MTTPIHKADFSFIFSVSIGSSFSFNLCLSDLLLLLQPSACKTTFLYFFFISIPSPFTSWLKILFLMISYFFCCGFFWLFYYKSEENTVEYICMTSAVFHSNSSLYCQRCITASQSVTLETLDPYVSLIQLWEERYTCLYMFGRLLKVWRGLWKVKYKPIYFNSWERLQCCAIKR